jgi:hypothetical protein
MKGAPQIPNEGPMGSRLMGGCSAWDGGCNVVIGASARSGTVHDVLPALITHLPGGPQARLGLSPVQMTGRSTSPTASYLALEAGDLVRRSPLFLRLRKRVHHFLRRRGLRANPMGSPVSRERRSTAHLEGR